MPPLAPKTPLFALKSKLRNLPMPWRGERLPAPIVHFRRGRAAGSYQLQVRQRLVEFALVSLPDFAERQSKLVLDHPHQVERRFHWNRIRFDKKVFEQLPITKVYLQRLRRTARRERVYHVSDLSRNDVGSHANHPNSSDRHER